MKSFHQTCSFYHTFPFMLFSSFSINISFPPIYLFFYNRQPLDHAPIKKYFLGTWCFGRTGAQIFTEPRNLYDLLCSISGKTHIQKKLFFTWKKHTFFLNRKKNMNHLGVLRDSTIQKNLCLQTVCFLETILQLQRYSQYCTGR